MLPTKTTFEMMVPESLAMCIRMNHPLVTTGQVCELSCLCRDAFSGVHTVIIRTLGI